jgi:hypothetical protein
MFVNYLEPLDGTAEAHLNFMTLQQDKCQSSLAKLDQFGGYGLGYEYDDWWMVYVVALLREEIWSLLHFIY